ncbi:MAG: ATP-dependent helicase [Candidatus Dormibacteria bacterium]
MAASHRGNHARLLAGPGTGKTRTLVELVASLINEGAASSDQILCLTFTRAAAAGLRRKVKAAIRAGDPPEVYTLHGFALRQLMARRVDVGAGPGRGRVADDWEERQVIEEDLKTLLGEHDVRKVRKRLRDLAAAWDSTPDSGIEDRHEDAELIGALRRHKDQYHYILRSELVFRLKEQLDADPYFPLKGDYQFIVVDEYQDLNRCDVAVVNALAARGATLYVAGDDDQSIYQELRNAHPQAIREFVSDHGAADLRLTVCVRCDQQILALANSVIRQEVDREPKLLVHHETAGPGILESLAFPTGAEEARGIARLAKSFVESDVSEGEILILLRSDFHGAFSAPIKTELNLLGVPAIVRTAEKSPLNEPPGRALLAHLRLYLDPTDDLSWRAVMETGALGVGDKAVAALHELAVLRNFSFSATLGVVDHEPTALGRYGGSVAGAVATVRARLSTVRSMAPIETATVTEVLDAAVGVLPTGPLLAEAQAELESLIALYAPTSLADFLGAIALRKEEEEDLVPGTINIMTAHRAKGLEACVVVIAAAEEELFPGRGHRDEERRLFYVSLTRAKHALFISFATRRFGQQARAGIRRRRHQRTNFLDGVGLTSRAGPSFVASYAPDTRLLSPVTAAAPAS